MNRRVLTIVLAIIFLVVVAVSVAVTSIRREALDRLPTQVANTYLFPDVETTSITEIQVTNVTANVTRKLTKIPGSWRIVTGDNNEVAMNLTRIPQMLQLLASLQYNRTLQATEQDIDTFGLAGDGYFNVTFTAKGRSYRLIIGGVNPGNTASYVQLDPKGPVFMANYNDIGLLVNIVDAVALTPVPQSTISSGLGQGTAVPSPYPVFPTGVATREAAS